MNQNSRRVRSSQFQRVFRISLWLIAVCGGLLVAGSAQASPSLFWSNDNEIMESNLDGTATHKLISLPQGRPPTSTYYINNLAANKRYVFWVNDRNGIGRMTRAGRRARLVLRNRDPSSFFSQDLRIAGNRIFWVRTDYRGDGDREVLHSANLAGRNHRAFPAGGSKSLGNLIGVIGNRLVWATKIDPDSQKERTGIFLSKKDGKARHQVGVLPGMSRNVSAVGVIGKRIYWTDDARRAVFSAGIQGKRAKRVAKTGRYVPYWLATGANHVVWGATLWGRSTIKNVIGTFKANGKGRRIIQRTTGVPGNTGLGPGLAVGP